MAAGAAIVVGLGWEVIEGVMQEVDVAALPAGFGEHFGQGAFEPGPNQARGIRLLLNGVMFYYSPIDPQTNGATVPVLINLEFGSVFLAFGDRAFLANIPAPAFTLQAGDQFGLGGRTGGANQVSRIDDVSIEPHGRQSPSSARLGLGSYLISARRRWPRRAASASQRR